MTRVQPDRPLGGRKFLQLLGGAAAAASISAACRLAGSAQPTGPATNPPFLPSNATSTTLAEGAPTMMPATPTPESLVGRVALVRSTDRAQGVRRTLDLLSTIPVAGQTLFLKPSFNSADPAPGSTHADTLRALVERLWAMGAASITLGDRSGMGDTRAVMQASDTFDLASELGCQTVVFDELGADGWVPADVPRRSCRLTGSGRRSQRSTIS